MTENDTFERQLYEAQQVEIEAMRAFRTTMVGLLNAMRRIRFDVVREAEEYLDTL